MTIPNGGEDKIASVYVFVVMEVGSRRIVHFNVTTHPSLAWVKQQIREAIADGRCPRFLVHDVVGSKGLPIPYGAPNANPNVERFIRTLRTDALDHFIFLSVEHLRRVVAEFVSFYNGARPSQAIQRTPDPYPELKEPPPKAGQLVALPVLRGLIHGYRLVA